MIERDTKIGVVFSEEPPEVPVVRAAVAKEAPLFRKPSYIGARHISESVLSLRLIFLAHPASDNVVIITSALLRGRLTPPASLAQGKVQLKHVRTDGRKNEAHDLVRLGELIAPRVACAELIMVALCCALCCVRVGEVTF